MNISKQKWPNIIKQMVRQQGRRFQSYYCPHCDYMVRIRRASFKRWNGKCDMCGQVKYAEFINQTEFYDRIHAYVEEMNEDWDKMLASMEKEAAQ